MCLTVGLAEFLEHNIRTINTRAEASIFYSGRESYSALGTLVPSTVSKLRSHCTVMGVIRSPEPSVREVVRSETGVRSRGSAS